MLGNLVLRTDLDFLWTGPSQFPKTASLLKESLLNQNQMQNMFSNPGFGLVSCKKKQKSAKVFGDFPFVPPDSAKLFSCPGRMIANSIPARLVATRTCMSLPCACTWPHHARVRVALPCTCARICHAQRPS